MRRKNALSDMTLSVVDENNSNSIKYTMLYRLPIYRKNSYCIQVKVYYYAHTITTYYMNIYMCISIYMNH